jgi:hypothetical protein
MQAGELRVDAPPAPVVKEGERTTTQAQAQTEAQAETQEVSSSQPSSGFLLVLFESQESALQACRLAQGFPWPIK